MAIPAVVLNEQYAIDGVVAILVANKNTYVNGYVFQDEAMKTPQIEGTPLAAPKYYPFIGVGVNNVDYNVWPEFTRSSGRDKPLMAEFDIEIAVANTAVVESRETANMSLAHTQFRGLIQRIVKSLWDNKEFVSNGYTFKLSEERGISVNNLTDDWASNNGYTAMMISTINYSITSRCQ